VLTAESQRIIVNEEQAQVEVLFNLVRELYREKQAGEIIHSFETVFASHEDPDERLNVIEYWLDFYRLQRYRTLKQRRRPTYEERITECSACGYPTSHRHHLWDIATHGENKVTIQLCANCHELQHLMYNALVKRTEYSQKLVLHALFSDKISRETAAKILGWCLATIRYEAANGWIEGGSDTREWVEMQLHWSEFLAGAQTAERR
jgi:ribosomal protein L37E